MEILANSLNLLLRTHNVDGVFILDIPPDENIFSTSRKLLTMRFVYKYQEDDKIHTLPIITCSMGYESYSGSSVDHRAMAINRLSVTLMYDLLHKDILSNIISSIKENKVVEYVRTIQ
jgi:hypothetical protein